MTIEHYLNRIKSYFNRRRWGRVKFPEMWLMGDLFIHYLNELAQKKNGHKGETIMTLNKDGSVDIIWRKRIYTKLK